MYLLPNAGQSDPLGSDVRGGSFLPTGQELHACEL